MHAAKHTCRGPTCINFQVAELCFSQRQRAIDQVALHNQARSQNRHPARIVTQPKQAPNRPRDAYSRFHLPYSQQRAQILRLLTHTELQAWCGSSCSSWASCSHRDTATASCMHPLGCGPTQLALACRSGSLVICHMAGLAAPPTGSLPNFNIPSVAITAPQVRICASGKCVVSVAIQHSQLLSRTNRGKGHIRFIVRHQRICDNRQCTASA